MVRRYPGAHGSSPTTMRIVGAGCLRIVVRRRRVKSFCFLFENDGVSLPYGSPAASPMSQNAASSFVAAMKVARRLA
jgi:hypothetical protein